MFVSASGQKLWGVKNHANFQRFEVTEKFRPTPFSCSRDVFYASIRNRTAISERSTTNRWLKSSNFRSNLKCVKVPKNFHWARCNVQTKTFRCDLLPVEPSLMFLRQIGISKFWFQFYGGVKTRTSAKTLVDQTQCKNHQLQISTVSWELSTDTDFMFVAASVNEIWGVKVRTLVSTRIKENGW